MKRRIFVWILLCCAVFLTLGGAGVFMIHRELEKGVITTPLSLAVPLFIIAAGACIFVSILLSNLLSASVSRRIGEIGESLKSLNEGEYRPLVTDSRDAELYSVLCQINDLNNKTHKYILKQTEQKQKLSLVLENINEGIVALGSGGKIMFANNRVMRIFDCRTSCVGKSLSYLIPNASLCDKVSVTEEPFSVFDYASDSHYYIVTVSKISKAEASSRISRIIVLADVTKEKSIAKEKSDFFANASHELKTPITVMQGHSELLLAKGTLGESETKQLERIHKECVRLSDLIADMLKLSGLERKEQELINTNISVRGVCEEVLAELSEIMRVRSICSAVRGDGVLHIDQKKLYELVSNLCTNAVKYNKDNGSLSIEIEPSDSGLTLYVRDTGIGIPQEHIPRLCERFYRVDKSRSKKTGGTGLGLAIVKHICVLYNADLNIESTLGEGTTVSVYFPNVV